ncbi:MAG: DUF3837 family protein [Lachnospiraceae bacterium]|nr:DUF3837 family protein [Lachnospiraceae bacterium]
MILDLVCEAVEIKIHFENFTGVIQSNFELGYALGKMKKKLGMELEKEEELALLKEKVEKQMESYTPEDFIEENLMKLIREYRMQDRFGSEISELIQRGYDSE